MRRVLVTGSSGFIGQYVREELIERGFVPVQFDIKNDPREDIRLPTVFDAMAEVDGFIHLAGILGTVETVDRSIEVVETNVLGGLNVLEAARQYHVSGVNIAVGNWWMNNPYSITKNSVERFIQMYNKEHGTKIVSVRTVNAYGPRQEAGAPFGPAPYSKIMPTFICNALTGGTIRLYGGGKQISDVVYVKDLARALVIALSRAWVGDVPMETMEFGPTVFHNSVAGIADMVNYHAIRAGAPGAEIVPVPMRAGEEENAKVMVKDHLVWFGVEESELTRADAGIEKAIDWYAKNKGVTWFEPNRAEV